MTPTDSGAAALVCTLRNAGPGLDSFIAYHHAIGFAHLYLVFDDPADPGLRRARALRGVTAIAHDATLRDSWRALAGWAEHGDSIDSAASRQVLNTEYAMGLARAAGFAWLLSIGADELFFAPAGAVAGHFADLSAWPFETVRYLGYAAIPERGKIADAFRDVDLFRPDARWLHRNRLVAMREAARTMPQFDALLRSHGGGRSAVRLAAPGIIPGGVHDFVRPDGSVAEMVAENIFILNYSSCARPEAIFDTAKAEALIRAGLAVRVDAPRRIIAAAQAFV